MPEIDLEKQETLERVYWVITLRNIAVEVALFLGAVAAFITRAFAPLIAGSILAVIVFIYNVIGWIYLKRKEAALNLNQITLLCFGQILADIIVITILVHVTGGILSPFVLMYLFGIMIMGFIASEKTQFVQSIAIFVILLYEGILALEFYRILPAVSVIKRGLEIYAELGFFLYFMLIFPTFVIVAVLLSTNIASSLTKGKKVLREQVEKLNGLRKHLETALGELGKKTSEISILYEFTARSVFPLDQFVSRLAEVVRAAIVEILLYEDGKTKTAAAFGYPAPDVPPTATLEVPLLHEGQKLGMLKFTCFVRKEFSEDEKRMANIIAERLAFEIAHLRGETQRLKLEKQLKEKLKELEEFHDLTVGRELKMIELEKEIDALLKELRREPKYK
jgi:hypothetical protein